jgi:hypothetical protein
MSIVRRALALAALCLAPSAFASSFSASYVVYMSVDAAKARPPNATERAFVEGAAMLGRFEVGNVTDNGSLVGGVFRLTSVGVGSRALRTLIPDDRLESNRSSEGEIRDGQLVTLRFSDRRGNAAALSYSADLPTKRYELRRGGQLIETGALTQANLDIAALPYFSLGRPAPTAPFAVAYTDGKTIKLADFRPARETLTIAGTTVATTRLTSAGSKPTDPRIEIWLRNEDSFPLRVRVSVSAQYGAMADQQIKALPPIFKPG